MCQTERRILIWSTVAMLATVVAFPLAKADGIASNGQPAFDVMQGDQIAHTLCANCHVVDTLGPVVRTDRVPSFSWIANQKGLTLTTLPVWLSTAHERMPDLNLTRDEIRQVSAYILSLRK